MGKTTQTKDRSYPWAIVTGASSGLGKAFAQILASWNYHLVLVARRVPLLDSLKAEISSNRTDLEIHCLGLDLASPGSDSELADFLAAKDIRPAFLVNNAGFGDWGPFAEADPSRLAGMVELNCRSLTMICRRLIPHMAAGGRVLNVASLAGFMPGPWMATYYATKAYVLSLSQALDHEVRKSGIRVSALCPGPVNTGFLAESGLDKSGALKSFKPVSAYEVALKGLKKSRRGKRIIMFGTTGFLPFLLRFVPRRLPLSFVARMQAPAGGHREKPGT